MDTISIDACVEYLNSLVEADRGAMHSLLINRVPCNDSLADHPAAIVSKHGDVYMIGLMGVINGMFGIEGGQGKIAYEMDETGLVRFVRHRARPLNIFEAMEQIAARGKAATEKGIKCDNAAAKGEV